MHLDQPINQYGSHLLVNVFLLLNISISWQCLGFGLSAVLINFNSVFRTSLRIFSLGNVNLIQLSLIERFLHFLEFSKSFRLGINWDLMTSLSIRCCMNSSLAHRKLSWCVGIQTLVTVGQNRASIEEANLGLSTSY